MKSTAIYKKAKKFSFSLNDRYDTAEINCVSVVIPLITNQIPSIFKKMVGSVI